MTEGFCKYTLHPEWYYVLAEDVSYQTPFRPTVEIDTPFTGLKTDGTLICKIGYGWNGPSGIPKRRHTGGMIYGALPHDSIYGLMCEGLLSRNAENRKMADQVLREAMRSAGSWAVTSALFYLAVRCKGRDYANPRSLNRFREILVAPK